MYSKQDASRLRQEFWTIFGQYMRPVLSADAEKINWINYKTGEKNLLFRMNAEYEKASIRIELVHRDAGIRELYFEQFLQLKDLLHETVGESWNWILNDQDENGRSISSIGCVKSGVNIFRKEDWPELISFFKPRIIALDEFWSGAKYAFAALQ